MKLDKDKVMLLFSVLEHQADILIHIFKMVYPNWDDIEKVEGWPTCSRETSRIIMQKFMDFDRVYHGGVMAGGLWFNSGFSTLEGEGMELWEVRPAPVSLKKIA